MFYNTFETIQGNNHHFGFQFEMLFCTLLCRGSMAVSELDYPDFSQNGMKQEKLFVNSTAHWHLHHNCTTDSTTVTKRSKNCTIRVPLCKIRATACTTVVIFATSPVNRFSIRSNVLLSIRKKTDWSFKHFDMLMIILMYQRQCLYDQSNLYIRLVTYTR